MRQADQPVAVRNLACQQAGPAGTALGGRAERLLEEHALRCQAVQVRRGDSAAVHAEMPPGIVSDDDHDVWRHALPLLTGLTFILFIWSILSKSLVCRIAPGQ